MTIDPLDVRTWPTQLTRFISELNKNNQDNFTESEYREFWEVTENLHIVGRHATCLLDSEVSRIQEHGLKYLSLQLVVEKLQLAINADLLSTDMAWKLLKGSTFFTRADEEREALIFFVTDYEDLRQTKHGLVNQLNIWGGESISFTKCGEIYEETLRNIGRGYVIEVSAPIKSISPGYELDWIIQQLKATLRGDDKPGQFSLTLRTKSSIPVKRIYELS